MLKLLKGIFKLLIVGLAIYGLTQLPLNKKEPLWKRAIASCEDSWKTIKKKVSQSFKKKKTFFWEK